MGDDTLKCGKLMVRIVELTVVGAAVLVLAVRGIEFGGSDNAPGENVKPTLSVSDKQYSAESKAQARASYEAGVADAVDARIEVVGRDYSQQMQRAAEYLGY